MHKSVHRCFSPTLERCPHWVQGLVTELKAEETINKYWKYLLPVKFYFYDPVTIPHISVFSQSTLETEQSKVVPW